MLIPYSTFSTSCSFRQAQRSDREASYKVPPYITCLFGMGVKGKARF